VRGCVSPTDSFDPLLLDTTTATSSLNIPRSTLSHRSHPDFGMHGMLSIRSHTVNASSSIVCDLANSAATLEKR
jgi:hypothetical protein